MVSLSSFSLCADSLQTGYRNITLRWTMADETWHKVSSSPPPDWRH